MWVVELAASMFLVDLLSGLVHMYLDYQVIGDTDLREHKESSIPAIQEFEAMPQFQGAKPWDRFLWDFQIHHQVPFPSAVSEWELAMQIARPVAIPYAMSVGAYTLGYLEGPAARIWLMALTLSPLVQATHFAAHCRTHGKLTGSYGRVVSWLQDAGLLLSPAAHKRHHETYDCNFCIFNGWANPLVNGLTYLITKPRSA
jgi:hypothetical protein